LLRNRVSDDLDFDWRLGGCGPTGSTSARATSAVATLTGVAFDGL